MRISRFPDIKTICVLAVLAFSSCSDGGVKDPNGDVTEPPLPERDPEIVATVKPKAMCIDTEANFRLFAKKSNVDAELEKIKSHGLNMIYLDVKPSNGYALYKSDMLPYCNEFASLSVTRDYDDFLGYFLEKCDELEIDVIASVNAMCWGWNDNKGQTQGLLYDQWEKWGDKVQVRSDEADPDKLIPITDDPLQQFMLLDPIYPEVQQLVVDACVEIVTKYPGIKGLSIDYLRYNNNDGGWFGLGDDNMKAYARYWNESVPHRHEIVTADGGIGPKFAKWLEFRSATVTSLLSKIHDAVKAVNPECEIHMWASADWGSRYSVGQNWASRNYIPKGAQYTETYNRTGFAHLLDVFVTGAYCKNVWIKDAPTSVWTVENFVTTWNDYIKGDCKCYGSIAAYELTPSQIADATYLCLRHTDGYMTFELSHLNNITWGDRWKATQEGIQRYEKNIK